MRLILETWRYILFAATFLFSWCGIKPLHTESYWGRYQNVCIFCRFSQIENIRTIKLLMKTGSSLSCMVHLSKSMMFLIIYLLPMIVPNTRYVICRRSIIAVFKCIHESKTIWRSLGISYKIQDNVYRKWNYKVINSRGENITQMINSNKIYLYLPSLCVYTWCNTVSYLWR